MSSAPEHGLVVSEVGMVSALGLDAHTACASARAGISRAGVLRTINSAAEDLFGGEPVLGHAAPCSISEGFVDVAKVSVLAEFALRDLLSRRTLSPAELARTGCHIVLSDCLLVDAYEAERSGPVQPDDESVIPSTIWKRETASLGSRLLAKFELTIPSARQRVMFAGHTGVASAILAAAAEVENGIIDRCLIGAIDSCVQPRSLRAAASLGILKTAAVASGYIPGEAGVFLLVEGVASSQARAPVSIGPVSVAQDDRTRLSQKPPLGSGLAQAIAACLGNVPPRTAADTRTIVSDLNGDPYRAMEWGYSLVRLRQSGTVEHMTTMLPAMSFGETGCAAGAVGICAAVRSLQRGYAGGGAVLVTLSSDDGSKAALHLTAGRH